MPFRPAFCRGGIQPTPRGASRTRKPSVTNGAGWPCAAPHAQAHDRTVILVLVKYWGKSGIIKIGVCRHSHGVILVSPPLKDTNSAPSRRRAPASGGVVPSERPWATQRHRSGGIHAPWTIERRAGCSSSPAGSCLSAMGGAVAQGTCAACAARARPWRRAFTLHDGPEPQAPYRPAAPGSRVALRTDRRR